MILFLPFLQMKSGHHQAAEALAAKLEERYPEESIEKIDILHYTFPRLERVVTAAYLKWIHYSPASYNRFFEKQFHRQQYVFKPFEPFEKKMLHALYTLILAKNPHYIICTHSFPSRLVGLLKRQYGLEVPLINVYTDFFVDSVWEKQLATLHMVPSTECAVELMEDYKIQPQQILVSGIPVHPRITKSVHKTLSKQPHVLIAGGNLGLIDKHLITQLQNSTMRFSILCGDNKKLYELVTSWNLPNVQPLPYITSRDEMNALYDKVDAVLSKPGGVTVSEALMKRLPFFSNYALPGQERLNLDYLTRHHLVFEVSGSAMLQQIEETLQNEVRMAMFQQAVTTYQQQFGMLDIENMTKVAQ